MFKYHVEKGAEITIVTKKMELRHEDAGKQSIIEFDDNNTIVDILDHTTNITGERFVSTNIIIFKREFLKAVILEAISHNQRHIYKDVIKNLLHTRSVFMYEHKGYYATISSIQDYFRCNMELLDPQIRENLFNRDNHAIYTKVRNSTPSKYDDNANVVNSLIADGCIIEGTVKNSILFRGVKVGKGTVIENSILLQDTYTGENVTLNCVVSDKNVVIRDGRRLSGHETMPFYIEKGVMI